MDLQDMLLVAGCACLITGAALIYRPAGFIVAGVMFLGHVYLIEVAKRPPAGKPPRTRRETHAERK